MNESLKQYIIPFLVGVAFIACGIVIHQIASSRGYDKGYSDGVNAPHKADTVWKERVVEIEKPVPVVQWKEREKLVYVPVNKDSLVYVHDTTYMPLQREYKQYSGENYTAQVSGVDPSLDWLKFNQPTAYITNTVVEKKRWSFGVTAGAGVFWDGRDIKPGAGIVAGVQYNF